MSAPVPTREEILKENDEFFVEQAAKCVRNYHQNIISIFHEIINKTNKEFKNTRSINKLNDMYKFNDMYYSVHYKSFYVDGCTYRFTDDVKSIFEKESQKYGYDVYFEENGNIDRVYIAFTEEQFLKAKVQRDQRNLFKCNLYYESLAVMPQSDLEIKSIDMKDCAIDKFLSHIKQKFPKYAFSSKPISNTEHEIISIKK